MTQRAKFELPAATHGEGRHPPADALVPKLEQEKQLRSEFTVPGMGAAREGGVTPIPAERVEGKPALRKAGLSSAPK